MDRLETVSAPSALEINGLGEERLLLMPEDNVVSSSGNGVHEPSPSFSRRLSHLRGQLSQEGWIGLQQRLSRNLSLEGLDERGDVMEGRQQRINSADCADPEFGSCRPQTALGRAVKAIAETFMLARLTLLLCSYLGLGWRWFYKFIKLCLYSTLLLPGFLQMMVFYFFSHRVIRSIPYGHKPRNRLDMFVPPGHWNMEHGLRPVVIYITGGAWTIGYKAWGSLLGRRLSKQGVMVCCLDYRNFPQGTGLDMLEDIKTGISWVLRKIMYYGGDPDQVYVVGQSCGAQLGMMALITQAEQEAHGTRLPGGSPSWSPTRIRGVVGVSGVYNCYDLAEHFHATGLYHSLFDRIMSINGKPELKLMSPTYCVKGVSWGGGLPRVLLLHGTKDICALVSNAVQFKKALQDAGAAVELKLYEGQTHTSPLIENPMRGGRDKLMDDILSFVQRRDIETRNRMLCPSLLIDLAARVCPF